MRAIGTSTRRGVTLLACLLLVCLVWAHVGSAASPVSGGTKRGASGQVYTWQCGSC